MSLIELRDLLLTIGVPVGHYEVHKQNDKYIVWAEDSEGASGHGDNKKTTQVLQGTIDYFTRIEYDPIVELIQEKLDSADIAWRLNSIQYEDDTGYTHHEWIWEMV